MRDGRIGLRINADVDHSPVPEVPGATARVETDFSDLVSNPVETLTYVDCKQLIKDAQSTTLMLLAL